MPDIHKQRVQFVPAAVCAEMRFPMRKEDGYGRTYWIIFILWTACALGLLAIGLFSYSGATAGENATMLGERRMVVHMGMTVLGFPANMFIPGFLSDLLKPFGYELFSVSHTSVALFVRDWAILFILGWVQWFVVLPAVIHWLMHSRKSDGVTSEPR